MGKDTITTRIEPELKTAVEAIFDEMGLKTSEAIRLFLKQCVNVGGLPFRPQLKQPNADTRSALHESENFKSLTPYKKAEDLFEDLEI